MNMPKEIYYRKDDRLFISKFKEVLQAIVPISFIVLLLHFFLVPLTSTQLSLFIIGTAFVLIGLTIFLLGVDVSINQMGHILGSGLTQSKNLGLFIFAGLFIGFIISIAEPSLTILGQQIETMSDQLLPQSTVIIIVSIGVAIFMTVGLLRIAFQWNIKWIISLSYLIIFILVYVVEESFITFGFDSSGATTGALTVPFMLALSNGVTSLSNESQTEEYHFGVVGITSIGPIISMLILGLIHPLKLSGHFPSPNLTTLTIPTILMQSLLDAIIQVLMGVMPLLLIFLIYHFFFKKQSPQTLKKILTGLIYLMTGLCLFLTGVASGFMPVSQYLGGKLMTEHSNYWVIFIGFTLGVVAILAEPAIYVLIDEIEEVTGGSLRPMVVLLTIALGVGSAIALTIFRIMVPQLRLWHILLIGFIIIIGFAWKLPNLFVGMAFDSGGTASGPMTGTFIFAFVQGIAIAHLSADPILDGFGMIAVVAMTPILFIEILGLIYHYLLSHEED